MPLSFFVLIPGRGYFFKRNRYMAEGSRKIIRLTSTESTNAVALRAGAEGAPSGTVVIADEQTGGRGRLKRRWLSPPGAGLYFSIILRPDLTPEDLAKITLGAGLAVSMAVEAACDLSPEIKWPNDLLLDGRKFGGILTETGAMQNMTKGQHPLVVVGVGLNIFPPKEGFPAELRERATALSLHVDREISAEKLLEACIAAIEETLKRLEKGGFQQILKDWLQRDAIRDRILTWVTPQGKKVTGLSLGPDEDGILHIRDEAGAVHTVLSGDISLAGKVS